VARTEKSTATRSRPARAPFESRLGPRQLGLLALAVSVLIALLLTVDVSAPGRGGFGAHLLPGDIADRSYKAPADLTLVDRAATEEHRDAALESAPVVYDYDERSGQELRTRVDAAFSAARAAQLLEAEDAAENSPPGAFQAALQTAGQLPEVSLALLERDAYGTRAQAELLRLLRPAMVRRIIDDRAEFERQSERRSVIVRELASGEEAVLESTDAVLGLAQARELVSSEAALAERSEADRDALVALAEALIKPNLSFNLRATDERRQAATGNVKEVTISLRKGEIVVRDGNPVTETHVQILRGIRDQFRTSSQLSTFLGASGLFFVVLVAIWRFGRSGVQRFAPEPRDAVFLLVTLLLTAVGTEFGLFVTDAVASNPTVEGWIGERGLPPLYYVIPIAAAAMLVRLVQTAETAALFAMVVAPISGFQVGGSLQFAIYTLVGSLVAAMGAARVTQRGTLLRAGVVVGVANVGVIAALTLLQEQLPSYLAILAGAAAGFVGGCVAGGLVSAFAPLAEGLFGYTTDVKLLELANREQPLLRELEIRAPGTYHHSMMVGHLAEKAAEAIGANALLAKVGGYYHDIGKMRRPHFFVENVTIHQGENRHEKLSPSMSARIIQAHVKDGLELGRQYKLAPGIMQGIGEHHGTSIIRFFYEKAKEMIDPEKGEAVEEHDYRYPGPKPQTREAGLLMLADSVEAASRTLADTSPSRIQQLVQRTINNYFRDGQMDECSLTLRDLNAIARSFIDTLSAIRHERIDYPDATDAEGRPLEEGVDEGVVERLEPRQKDRQDPAASKREDDLRRLGLP
jgi:putative nucleotidyltransferase with HDIG domain